MVHPALDHLSLRHDWDLLHASIQSIWALTEPQIEEAAIRLNIPIELYYCAELGTEHFSAVEFQQRDPFTNPEQFEKLFARLNIKDWILPTRTEGRYQVPEKTHQAVRQIIQAGDERLLAFDSAARMDLSRLLSFLKQIVLANNAAAEPPEKWAITHRFHTATRHSPPLVQIRECLMDIYAYRDDAHLAAARPYFNEAGIVWSAFRMVCNRQAVTADQIATSLTAHGYEAEHYVAALAAAQDAGWIEPTEIPGAYRPTSKGKEMHAQVEHLTDEYFYRPWAMFEDDKLTEFHELLQQFYEQIRAFSKRPIEAPSV